MKAITDIKHLIKVLLKRETVYFRSNKLDSIDIFTTPDIKNINTKKYTQIVGIDGIGFSGSSAITDFLAEFSDCTVYGGVDMKENPDRGIENSYEVDFFRDPYGVLELEKICNNNVTRIRNKAISDFIELTKNNYLSNCPLYDTYYLSETRKFLESLIDYIIPIKENVKTYVPKKLSVSEYRSIAKSYIKNFLEGIESEKNLILDNVMSIGEGNTPLLSDYFGNFKLIYVYCDPRDIYARARLFPGNDWVPVDPQLFCKFFLREFPLYLHNQNQNILCVSFDEFCQKYDKVSIQIMNFLGLSEKEHIHKYKYFNPSISVNNTKVYKKLENQEPIDYIYKNLKEYCWSE